MELSDNLLCLFNAEVKGQDGSFVIEVPQHEIDVGDIEAGKSYRVAMVASQTQGTSTAATESTPERSRPAERDGPPVEEGEVLDVEIEDVGDQGDGIARVGPGYVVIVPGTDMGERVSVEISEVRENMAFADVVERYDNN